MSGKIPIMENLGLIERLKLAESVSGIKPAPAAERAGLKIDFVRDVLRQKKKEVPAAALEKLAEVYGVDFTWLATGKGDPPKVRTHEAREPDRAVITPPHRAEKIVMTPYEGPALAKGGPEVPVYAAARGGDGHLIITIDPIEYAAAPDSLIGVRDAYGIQIVGESMVPAYEPGDVAWVHPHKTPQRGKDCVLYHGKPTGISGGF